MATATTAIYTYCHTLSLHDALPICNGAEALFNARNQLLAAASQSPILAGVRPEGQEDAPQLRVMIDRIQARALGLSIGDVNGTLAIAFGSAYANDFNREGRILRVLLQAKASHRMTPQDRKSTRLNSSPYCASRMQSSH